MARGNRKARQNTPVSRTPADSQPSSPCTFLRALLHSITLIALGAVITSAIMTSLEASTRRSIPANASGGALPFDSAIQPAVNSVSESGPRTVWQLLAQLDSELEKVDVVELNLAVAREIPGLEDLDIAKHQRRRSL